MKVGQDLVAPHSQFHVTYVLVYGESNRFEFDSPYPRTFYPGTTDLASAVPIVLNPRGEKIKADNRLGGSGGGGTR
jgi:hypothetical protein